MEKRRLLGAAVSGCPMVLPNWKRLLVLNVSPPPATTLRTMENRPLLCASAREKASGKLKANTAKNRTPFIHDLFLLFLIHGNTTVAVTPDPLTICTPQPGGTGSDPPWLPMAFVMTGLAHTLAPLTPPCQ